MFEFQAIYGGYSNVGCAGYGHAGRGARCKRTEVDRLQVSGLADGVPYPYLNQLKLL